MLKKMGTGQGYLKAGLLGFPKSGKTFTAALLAVGLRADLSLEGPIAMFDTEAGSEYIAHRIRDATKQDLVGVRSRSFDDMLACGKECESANVSVLIVDSITHPWRELCESHLAKINAKRKANGKAIRLRLEFQDWNVIKPYWAQWTDFYLNSKLHIIICGRAGFEWDFTEPDEETGKRELIKVGVKMKTEGEFGFEPSLLVDMERVQKQNDNKATLHRATVLGDRFGVIDGKQMDEPDYNFFKPHIDMLKPGTHAPVDTKLKTDTGVDDEGNTKWQKEKLEREILCEEIKGEFHKVCPGQTTADKQLRSQLLELFFHTRSWKKVTDKTNSSILRDGLDKLRIHIFDEKEKANAIQPESESSKA